MNDSIFLDTNILIYSYSYTEPTKQAVARKIISGKQIFISTQVLQELVNVLNKKFRLDWQQISKALVECSNNFLVYRNDEMTISEACRLAEKYKYSFYDSLIISAALKANCDVLYSEDMTSGHVIDGKLKILNPFN